MNYPRHIAISMSKARTAARKRLTLAHPEEYTRYLQSEYDKAGINVKAKRPVGASAERKKAAAQRRELRRLKKIEALKKELEALQS